VGKKLVEKARRAHTLDYPSPPPYLPPPPPPPPPLPQAIEIVHGRNFMAMQRDTKSNSLQHSASHLETRFARLDKFEAAVAAEAAAGSAGGGGEMDVDDEEEESSKKKKKKSSSKKSAKKSEPSQEDMDFAAKQLKLRK
jgi:hypothetical protein